MTELELGLTRPLGIIARRTAIEFVILALTIGCACLFRPHYPTAALTRLLREDSTSILGFGGYT